MAFFHDPSASGSSSPTHAMIIPSISLPNCIIWQPMLAMSSTILQVCCGSHSYRSARANASQYWID